MAIVTDSFGNTVPTGVTPTGLSALLSSKDSGVQKNPFVTEPIGFDPVQSIIAAAQAPGADQEALGRALFGTTGLPETPQTNRETAVQDARRKQAGQLLEKWRAERAKVELQLSDPGLGIDDAGRQGALRQVDQRWMQQVESAIKPAPIDLYQEFERQDKPETRSVDMAKTAKHYMKTGEWDDNFSAIFGADIPIADSVKFVTDLAKARKDATEGTAGVSVASKNSIINNLARLADDVEAARQNADAVGANAALNLYQTAVRAAIDTGVVSPTTAATFNSPENFSASREMQRLLMPGTSAAPEAAAAATAAPSQGGMAARTFRTFQEGVWAPQPFADAPPIAKAALAPSTAGVAQSVFTAKTTEQAQGIIERARALGRKSVTIRDAATNETITVRLQ